MLAIVLLVLLLQIDGWYLIYNFLGTADGWGIVAVLYLMYRFEVRTRGCPHCRGHQGGGQ